MYNLLYGGAAGDGLETMSTILEKVLKRSGYYVFTTRDFMSRIRGGHNFMQIRFGNQSITSHRDGIDVIVALNEETVELHKGRLLQGGIILCDTSLSIEGTNVLKFPLKETAKQLGNSKIYGSVAMGAILKLFSIPLDKVEEVLAANFKTELVTINSLAVKEGYHLATSIFSVESRSLKDYMAITGTTAMALGALAANIKFYCAYPMSPATGLLEYLTANGEQMGVAVEQAEDEIAAVNMAIGASNAGARAMTGTSGGGFSLMVEALGLAGIAEIPLVIANVQRPGPATGLPTRTEQSDLKFVISASQGEFPRMVIAIRNHADAFYQTARTIALAEKYQIPIILLSDQYLGDTTATIPLFELEKIYKYSEKNEKIELDENGLYQRYYINEKGISPRLIPGKSEYHVRVDSDEHDVYGQITESAHIRKKMVEKRMKKLELLETELLEPEIIGDIDMEHLIVAFGSTYGPIKEAVTILNANGGKYGALVFGDVYPLPQKLLLKYKDVVKDIINIEQNATGQLASLLRESMGLICNKSILKYDGRQLSVDYILNEIQMFSKEVD